VLARYGITGAPHALAPPHPPLAHLPQVSARAA
jgi:hypothetical protein